MLHATLRVGYPPRQPRHARLPHPSPLTRSGNALTGTLDPSLEQGWPLMEDLDMGINQLRGPVPPSFSVMGRLKRLGLA